MGKAQRLKEIRKEEREKRAMAKTRRDKLIKKAVVYGFGCLVLFGLLFLGYKKAFPLVSKYFKKEEVSQAEEKKPENKVSERKYSKAPDMVIDTAKKYTANFETNKGNFKIELLADKAPKTVNNFVFLARDKFYDGLIFHRIIKDFMIQGGDPQGNGTGDPGYKFEDEQNDIALERGVLAMANSGPNTNGSQFFIITKDKTEWLQGKHTAFGRVVEGLEKVLEIEKVETGENDKPKESVVINKVTIEEK